MSDAKAGSPAMRVTNALDAVGEALKQLAFAMRELVIAMWHGAAAAGQLVIQHPTALIAGIAIGILFAGLLWIADIGIVQVAP